MFFIRSINGKCQVKNEKSARKGFFSRKCIPFWSIIIILFSPFSIMDSGTMLCRSACNQKVNMDDFSELGTQWKTGYNMNILLDVALNWLYGLSP